VPQSLSPPVPAGSSTSPPPRTIPRHSSPITPVRVLDTRSDVGLAGPLVSAISQDLHLTGTIPTTTGTQLVVPDGATAVVMNVTAVSPTRPVRGHPTRRRPRHPDHIEPQRRRR
jgi:hypothetical protein